MNFFSKVCVLVLGFVSINGQVAIDNNRAPVKNSKYEKYLQLTHPVNPETTVFAFDLHDVLFSKNYRTVSLNVVKTLRRGMFWYVLNPFFIFRAFSIALKDFIWEDIFYKLSSYYQGFDKFKEDFFDISNSCCEPIVPMIEVLKDLKASGYKLFLLSNIGNESYDNFKPRFTEIMSLFDGQYLPSKENDYHHKPNLKYYQSFIEYLNKQGLKDKQIIFIDDLSKNLEGAFKVGISGIHCVNSDFVIETLKYLSVLD